MKRILLVLSVVAGLVSTVWAGDSPPTVESNKHAIDLVQSHADYVWTLVAAAGAVLAMGTSWAKFGKPEIGMSLNGALAGLVAITAPCATVTPLSAVIIGSIGGVIVVRSVLFFDKIRVDDPVGAISVHGVCGHGVRWLLVSSTSAVLLPKSSGYSCSASAPAPVGISDRLHHVQADQQNRRLAGFSGRRAGRA